MLMPRYSCTRLLFCFRVLLPVVCLAQWFSKCRSRPIGSLPADSGYECPENHSTSMLWLLA
ncbi:hypothetical protein T4E_7348 [Trichinella pseudospiralis]|uniref:Uncharacterized protein n=1 Tax=Trichinella pseudospiralis TaxID=6337 RepID=A0A0V0XNL1_TRIPS|nr:hypothetical protein T4E_7348 [Trichinella pseudospiralis]